MSFSLFGRCVFCGGLELRPTISYPFQMESATDGRAQPVPSYARNELFRVAQKVFWWGQPEAWLDDTSRFVAQVMVYGDLEDIEITLRLMGDVVFLTVLDNPPSGLFDIKSWTFWNRRYHRNVPPLAGRILPG